MPRLVRKTTSDECLWNINYTLLILINGFVFSFTTKTNRFHGRCVGILQCEAENIDEYICPNCQKNSSVNFANMKDMGNKEYEELKKLIKQIQVGVHLAKFAQMYCNSNEFHFNFSSIQTYRAIKALGHSWNRLIKTKHPIIMFSSKIQWVNFRIDFRIQNPIILTCAIFNRFIDRLAKSGNQNHRTELQKIIRIHCRHDKDFR